MELTSVGVSMDSVKSANTEMSLSAAAARLTRYTDAASPPWSPQHRARRLSHQIRKGSLILAQSSREEALCLLHYWHHCNGSGLGAELTGVPTQLNRLASILSAYGLEPRTNCGLAHQ